MGRFLRVAGMLVLGWLVLILLMMLIPRRGLGQEIIPPGDGVVYTQQLQHGSHMMQVVTLQTHTEQRVFAVPPNDCFSISDDGHYLVTANNQRETVQVYDILSRTKITQFKVLGRLSLCPNLIENTDTVTFFGGNSPIERYNIYTGERVILPSTPLPESPPREVTPQRDIVPTVSDPTGRYLFYSRCLGNIPVNNCDEDWAYVVYDMHEDTVLTALLDADHQRLAFTGSQYFGASWSPDGRYLLYPPVAETSLDVFKLHLYDLENNATTVITPPENGLLEWPQWSPDGTRIQLFVNSAVNSPTVFDEDMWLVVYDVPSREWAISPSRYRMTGSVVWSPRSDAVLLQLWDVRKRNNILLVHMDAETGKITTIGDVVVDLKNWFSTPPQ